MSDIVISVVQPTSTVINVGIDETTLIEAESTLQSASTIINVGVDETTLIQAGMGLPPHSATHISGGSDEVNHNYLVGLQGGVANQFYHLNSGEYSNLVYTTGNQTISGAKTFVTEIIAPNLVYNTGDQFISGIKIFGELNYISNSPYSHILGGYNNDINDSNLSIVNGGFYNDIISSEYSTINGGSTNSISSSNYSSIAGGFDNNITGSEYSTINGGYGNSIGKNNYPAGYSRINNGYSNKIYGVESVIDGGNNNTLYGNNSVIFNGQNNLIDFYYNDFTFDYQNSNNCSIINGTGNIIFGDNANVVLGNSNKIGGFGSYVIAGNNNNIGGDANSSDGIIESSKIIASNNNRLDSRGSLIIGGASNTVFSLNKFESENNSIIASRGSLISGVGNAEIDNNLIIGGGTHKINGVNRCTLIGGQRSIGIHNGAMVLADWEGRDHFSKGNDSCSLDFAGGVFISSGGLKVNSTNHQIILGTGDGGNKITLTTPLNIAANRTYTIPDIGSSAAFVLTQGPQTIGGEKTFTNNIVGSGTNNLFINEEGDSPHSLLTQQQLMLNGHKFRQGVCVNTKKVGLMPETVAEQFQVLGMKASIGNNIAQAAAAYTLDGLFCSDVSVATLPINNEIDAYFHGVAMQFLPNVNWKARINFGVPYSKSIAYANQPPTNTTQQWGVEFYYNGTNFVGRLYFFYDPPIIYGTPFTLPLYTGANYLSWEGFVYSVRMRQVVVSANRLRLEFYMNTSASNSGGTQLSKTTPLATLLTPVITNPNFRFDGKHINFEVVSNGAGITPSGQIRMQSTNMYCQFK
jgi:hypothetical protein